MPTGGGKNMLFMLPVHAIPGVCTVVVAPLISSRADLMKRCHELGIRRHERAAIVLMTPGSTENPDFHTFFNRQRFLRRLDRIVR
ncbi:hypothetical protein BDV12DRAFT_181060 [Aspergillus spectabilis]